jgi:mRNA-degrading endonuclease RelE of RelBE toxin-antitoxin system
MYQIELSEAVLDDLNDFSPTEVDEIYAFLLSLADNPTPAGIQTLSLPEAASGIAYLYETTLYSIYYEIFDVDKLVKVVAIFKKINLN